MTLVRIAKEWDWPDILRQTPGGNGVWEGAEFRTEDVEECDALVVLNNRVKHDVRERFPQGRVRAQMQKSAGAAAQAKAGEQTWKRLAQRMEKLYQDINAGKAAK